VSRAGRSPYYARPVAVPIVTSEAAQAAAAASPDARVAAASLVAIHAVRNGDVDRAATFASLAVTLADRLDDVSRRKLEEGFRRGPLALRLRALVAVALFAIAAVAGAAVRKPAPAPHQIRADVAFTLCATPVGSGGPCDYTRPAYLVLGLAVSKNPSDPKPPVTYNRWRSAYVQLEVGVVGTTCDDDPELTAYDEVGSVPDADASSCPPEPPVYFTPGGSLAPIATVLDFGAYTRTVTIYFGPPTYSGATWIRLGTSEVSVVDNPRACDGDPSGNIGVGGFTNVEVCSE